VKVQTARTACYAQGSSNLFFGMDVLKIQFLLRLELREQKHSSVKDLQRGLLMLSLRYPSCYSIPEFDTSVMVVEGAHSGHVVDKARSWLLMRLLMRRRRLLLLLLLLLLWLMLMELDLWVLVHRLRWRLLSHFNLGLWRLR
jgi:hypothetical protein